MPLPKNVAPCDYVEITDLDKPRKLFFNIPIGCEYNKLAGISPLDSVREMLRGDRIDLLALCRLLYIGLKTDDVRLTEQRVQELVDEAIRKTPKDSSGAVIPTLLLHVVAAMKAAGWISDVPEEETEGEDPNPPTTEV